MLTDEQKRQLGARPELIPLQEKVRTDIYNILKKLGCEPQTPDCVGISTENGIHRIAYYPFNVEKIWGYYKYHLPYLMVKTDYKFKDLKKMIKIKVVDIEKQQVKGILE